MFMSTFQQIRRLNLPGGTIALSFLLIFFQYTVLAQAVRVTGSIVTSSGEPVGFASVAVKGGSAAVVADEKGLFSINAAPNATLIVTSVGYERQELAIDGRTSIKITLVSTASSLQDVVVIGYGTQRKEAVTGSVASISGTAMREVPSANVSQALQGRMAGVQMAQTSSRPGAAMQIRIRGARSLTATNDPLIVLDGIPFPGSIADLNPDDIKSVDVLKDASATAIYGSRGANGVILITTNKGQKGARPRFAYNGYAGNQTVFGRYPMMDAREFTTLKQIANRFPALGVDEDSSGKVNTDWQDLLYQTGTVNSQDVNVTGAGEGGSYNAGMGYYRNQGVIPTQRYTRYSFRAGVDQLIGKHFRIGFTTNNNYNISEGSQVGVNLMLSPLANPYNANGSTKRTVNTTLGDSYVLTKGVVDSLSDNGLWLNETRNFATYNSAYGEVQIPGVTGLKYRVNLGLDFIQSNNGNYTAQGVNSVNATTESSAGVSNSQTYHWTVENILSYDRTFAEKHSVNVTALYSAEQQKFNTSSMAAKGIPSDAFQFYNLGNATGEITVNPANQGYYLWGLMSWMGRVMYAYDNRYMISATVRSDGSSRLAPGHQWHTYPAVSAGWNVANESFMQQVKWLSSLKLRAGFGQTSNQAINPYATLGALSTRPYNFGSDNYSIGYYVTQLPNASLGWEYSKTWNYGIDFGLFQNRLTGTIEYYITQTNDLLQSVGLPQTSGVNSYTANVGKTENKGIEITLNGTILDGGRDGVSWDAGFNLYANRNKLVALASGSTKDEGNGWFVGHNINSVYDYKKIGLWQEKEPYLNILEPGGAVGMIKVLYTGGFNDDGTPKRAIGADDRQVLDLDPKFMGGFNTRVAYKGFDLAAVGVFQHGGTLISSVYGSGGYLNTLTTRNNNVKVDYWTPENTDAKYPNPAGPLSGDNPKYGSTLGYFDASFLKIRTISLGYDFSRSLIKSKNIKLRAYFTVQNPFVLWSPYTKESGMDPETNSYGNENAAVPLSGSLRRLLTIGVNTPSTRNYIIGVNLSF
ncbi:TonB-dependent receptor [Chitinophaga sp. sic0106]|uniref:SusC/RagA family TonB-linked outer membrane protein n=1 Tax=Chitinophaga sp. sic0106 TaxID=2854785 RepID=UPI001C48A706|nr:TonB-dependent receptor [Chitinophaga sp. sic0106]MBV7532124.1 TonB-dependent receptor [Chitinophaga sp. sic0106]